MFSAKHQYTDRSTTNCNTQSKTSLKNQGNSNIGASRTTTKTFDHQIDVIENSVMDALDYLKKELAPGLVSKLHLGVIHIAVNETLI